MDLFSGTGAALVAGLIQGSRFKKYYAVDLAPLAMARMIITAGWAITHFPFQVSSDTFINMFDYLDVTQLTSDIIMKLGVTVITSGSPCQGFSRGQLDPAKAGLRHP